MRRMQQQLPIGLQNQLHGRQSKLRATRRKDQHQKREQIMVHCFTYTHKGNPLYFVWDVESGSLHNVDEAAFLVSKKRYQQLSDDENKRFLKTPLDNLHILL